MNITRGTDLPPMPATVADLDAALTGYTGTDDRYRHPLNRRIEYTDGVKALADLARAYWLLDVVASHGPTVARKAPRTWAFGIVRLHVLETDGGRRAIFDWREDTDAAPVLAQMIPYTDFPLGVLELYVAGGVVMLKREY